ncbi:MAG: hypothetical protein ACI91R_001605 [Vicingaceae bacterium]|jgi:hypothetical protein
MWDWRYPINNIRDEVRKGRTQGESVTSLDSLDNLLDQLSSSYERLEKEDAEKAKAEINDDKEYIEKQKELIITSYEHGKQYTNIIIFGGYAGLFTIWNFTKDQLQSWQVLSVGLCILLSLFLYITFELYGSWLRTTQVSNQIKELEEAEKLHELPENYGKSEQARAAKFISMWPYFFFSAIGFALIAAFILIYSFISGLWRLYA